MKNVLITGPTGSIGHALIELLLGTGCTVYAVCNPSSTRNSELPSNPSLNIVKCGLNELSCLKDMIPEKCDAAFHLAWAGTTGADRNNVDMQMNNIKYSIDAVKASHALGCSVFVGAGSQAEYGRVEGTLYPDTPVSPENGYGIAKLAAGQLTRMLCSQYGLRHIWTRILSVYGPYDGKSSMIMSTLRALMNGQKPLLTKGEQKWDYLYSRDAAKALYLLGIKGVDGEVYTLGGGNERPLRDYVEILRNAIDPNLKLGFGKIPYAEKQVMHLYADISKLKRDTGFEPDYSFIEGIEETIKWYKGSPNEKD